MRNFKITFTPITFKKYVREGALVDQPGCHALMYYALIQSKNVFEADGGKKATAFEGDRDSESDAFQLFQSIALAYGTTPEEMVRFWKVVDAQFDLLGFKPLGDPWRFDTVPEIRTH